MSEMKGSHQERTKQTKIYLPRTCLVMNLHYSRGVKTLYCGSSVDGPNCLVPCLPTGWWLVLQRKRGPLTKWVASTNVATTWASVSLSTSRVSYNPTSGLVLSTDAVGFGRAQESHLSTAALSINAALDKLLGLPVMPPCCLSSLLCGYLPPLWGLVVSQVEVQRLLSSRVTVPMSVPSVPPEAVNMSLGLSLTAAANPSRLLVSALSFPGGSGGVE